MTRWLRAGCIALVPVVAFAAAGCSSDSGGSSDGGKGTPTTSSSSKGKPEAPLTWAGVVKDPCKLLPVADVADVLPKEDPKLVASDAATCRYQMGPQKTVGVDVYAIQTDESLASRTAGAPLQDGVARLPLNSPGAGRLVSKDHALVLVTVRSSVGPYVEAEAAVTDLAARVAERLPKPPAAGTALTDLDPCGVFQADDAGKGTIAADVTTPQQCGYQLADRSTLTFQVVPDPASGSTPISGDPWKGGPKGATWQAVPSGAGGTAQGYVPLDGGTLVINVASPVRSLAKLQELAANVAAAFGDAAGG